MTQERSFIPLTPREYYYSLRLIRRTEERIAEIYPTDAVKSPIHLSIGQEAASVGICAALQQQDIVSGTYRGHALYLARGGDLDGMMAELYGKKTGIAGGKGGSMHLIGRDVNMMGTSAVVATSIPVALGLAFKLQQSGEDAIAVVFFGDGATEEGAFWESLNFAYLKRLPLMFVCENNGYAIHSPISSRQPPTPIHQRVAGFDIETRHIENGWDVSTIHQTALEARDKLVRGQGPIFIELDTNRWREHVGPNEDYDFGYRDPQIDEMWIAKDPLEQLGKELDPDMRADIDQEIEGRLDKAMKAADAAPYPDESDLLSNIYG